jgi:hypothetical protein
MRGEDVIDVLTDCGTQMMKIKAKSEEIQPVHQNTSRMNCSCFAPSKEQNSIRGLTWAAQWAK